MENVTLLNCAFINVQMTEATVFSISSVHIYSSDVIWVLIEFDSLLLKLEHCRAILSGASVCKTSSHAGAIVML